MSWRAVVRVLRSPAGLLDDVVTTVFPADCRCCDGPLLRAGLVPVCETCVGRVRQSRMAACGCCGEALGLDLNLDDNLEDARFAGQMAHSLRCRECRMAEPAFTRAVSYAGYEDELRTLIGLLKFEGMRGLAGMLGDKLAEAVLRLEGSAGFAATPELLVVAVPLFAARERQRGYNQSVLLAERAVKRLRKVRPEWTLTAAHPVLQRVRQTAAQFELAKAERRRNLRGAFAVPEAAMELLRGREVLLVDDIMTSGATARECARVLRRGGAARVWVATLARAQKQEFARLHEDPGDGVVAKWGA
jgi:ComF family protein